MIYFYDLLIVSTPGYVKMYVYVVCLLKRILFKMLFMIMTTIEKNHITTVTLIPHLVRFQKNLEI